MNIKLKRSGKGTSHQIGVALLHHLRMHWSKGEKRMSATTSQSKQEEDKFGVGRSILTVVRKELRLFLSCQLFSVTREMDLTAKELPRPLDTLQLDDYIQDLQSNYASSLKMPTVFCMLAATQSRGSLPVLVGV